LRCSNLRRSRSSSAGRLEIDALDRAASLHSRIAFGRCICHSLLSVFQSPGRRRTASCFLCRPGKHSTTPKSSASWLLLSRLVSLFRQENGLSWDPRPSIGLRQELWFPPWWGGRNPKVSAALRFPVSLTKKSMSARNALSTSFSLCLTGDPKVEDCRPTLDDH
jgi:hypothetical protein